MLSLLFNQKLTYDTKCQPSIHFLNTKGQPLCRKCPLRYIRSTCNNANTSVSDVNPNATSSVIVSFIQLKAHRELCHGSWCMHKVYVLSTTCCRLCYRLESCHILFWNWLSKIQLVLVLPSQTAPGLEPCVNPPDTWSFNVVLGTPYSVAAHLVDIVPSCAAFSAPALPHILLHWCSSSLRMLTPFWQLWVN